MILYYPPTAGFPLSFYTISVDEQSVISLPAEVRNSQQMDVRGLLPQFVFYNKDYPLNAHVVTLGGFSAHGEEEQSLAFGDYLKEQGLDVVVPRHGQSVEV